MVCAGAGVEARSGDVDARDSALDGVERLPADDLLKHVGPADRCENGAGDSRRLCVP
jgi:hypothetical protein